MMWYINPCTHDDVYITKMCDTQEMHIWHISSHEYAHQEIHIRRYTSGYMAHQEIHNRHRVYGTPGDTHLLTRVCTHRLYTRRRTGLLKAGAYTVCNRMHEYISLLTYTCIHGWPTDRNTSPHINVHTWCVHQEVHKPPRMHVHAYTACAPKCVHA